MTLEPVRPVAESKDFLVFTMKESGQRIDPKSGRIAIGKKGWLYRLFVVISFIGLSWVIITKALTVPDWWVGLAVIMPIHTMLLLGAGWVNYRNPPTRHLRKLVPKTPNEKPAKLDHPRASVLLPVYNQEKVIHQVVDQVLGSSIRDIELIAVNDGSTDSSGAILEQIKMSLNDDRLRVVQKKNEGKRKAIATGFPLARGKYILVMDSDSIIEHHAIERLVTTLDNNPEVGACVAHIKVWNADHSLMTKLQDCLYDFAFNLFKACESSFGCVTCCSGCLSAYRREAIESFIPYWSNSPRTFSDDRELTSFAVAPKSGKVKMMLWDQEDKSLSQRIMKHAAAYDDAEDRALTATAMKKWKSVYVADAFVYTEVPDNIRQFYKQQLRWRKGYVRVNAFVGTFMWKRNPLMAFIYYYQVFSVFLHPVLTVFILLYEPLVLHEYWFPLYVLAVLVWRGFAFGLDYKIRDPNAKHWLYQVPMAIFEDIIMSWVIIPALLKLRQNHWGTR